MKCDHARLLLLEADLEELRGEAQSPLSEHVRSCPRCGSMAAYVTEGEEMLRAALGGIRPRVSVEDASKRAVTEARLRRRRQIWHGIAPVAAAAGLAGVLLVSLRDPTPGPLGAQLTTVEHELPPIVEAAPGQRVAVFETDNPSIVVVWSF